MSAGKVAIQMTLTAPGCPSAQYLPVEVESKVHQVPGVNAVSVEVVWEPALDARPDVGGRPASARSSLIRITGT